MIFVRHVICHHRTFQLCDHNISLTKGTFIDCLMLKEGVIFLSNHSSLMEQTEETFIELLIANWNPDKYCCPFYMERANEMIVFEYTCN